MLEDSPPSVVVYRGVDGAAKWSRDGAIKGAWFVSMVTGLRCAGGKAMHK